MAVYTIVFSFRGTPVTRQVTASTAPEALASWAKTVTLPKEKRPNVNLEDVVAKEKLVAATGTTNVWSCFLPLGQDDKGKNENGVVVVVVTQVDAVYHKLAAHDGVAVD